MTSKRSKLEQLRDMTIVVADSGNIEEVERHRPVDATTNPSLLLKALQRQGSALLLQAVNAAREEGGTDDEQLAAAMDLLAVQTGLRILEVIPGRVSTEVDARLSFNAKASIARARSIIARYEASGIGPERVLIKIAATWEGIRAAEQLEREGIQTNLTLLFSFAQAVAAANAGATLISPFVGRIYDWHCRQRGVDHIDAREDPGVESVTRIYQHFKSHGYNTIVMGASFRNRQQIEQLAGCDRLTISPALLQELDGETGELPRMLEPDRVGPASERIELDEPDFRYALNEDAMATEKLAEGIRLFAADAVRLEQALKEVAD